MVLSNAITDGETSLDTFTSEDSNFENSTSPPSSPFIARVNKPPHTLEVDVHTLDFEKTFRTDKQRQELARMIEQRCQLASEALKRPLRQSEMAAFAENLDRGKGSLDMLNLTLGFSCLSFGIWRHLKHIRGSILPSSLSKVASGESSRSKSRFATYTRIFAPPVVTYVVGRAFIQSFASTMTAVRDLQDPRLAEYKELITSKMKERNNPLREINTTTQNETFEQRRQRERVQRMPGRSARVQEDDASPTSGWSDDDWKDFGSAKQEITDRESIAKPSTTRDAEPVPARQDDGSDFYGFDDKPAQSQPNSSTTPGPISQAAGNAWDRIRKEATQSRAPRRD